MKLETEETTEETLEEESLKCPHCGSAISISVVGAFFYHKGKTISNRGGSTKKKGGRSKKA